MKGCKRIHCEGWDGCLEVRASLRQITKVEAVVKLNPIDCLLLATKLTE